MPPHKNLPPGESFSLAPTRISYAITVYCEPRLCTCMIMHWQIICSDIKYNSLIPLLLYDLLPVLYLLSFNKILALHFYCIICRFLTVEFSISFPITNFSFKIVNLNIFRVYKFIIVFLLCSYLNHYFYKKNILRSFDGIVNN